MKKYIRISVKSAKKIPLYLYALQNQTSDKTIKSDIEKIKDEIITELKEMG